MHTHTHTLILENKPGRPFNRNNILVARRTERYTIITCQLVHKSLVTSKVTSFPFLLMLQGGISHPHPTPQQIIVITLYQSVLYLPQVMRSNTFPSSFPPTHPVPKLKVLGLELKQFFFLSYIYILFYTSFGPTHTGQQDFFCPIPILSCPRINKTEAL